MTLHLPEAVQTPSRRQTDTSDCLLCLPGASILWGTRRDASYKFKGADKNPGSTNKYTKVGRLIIRKIIKIIATSCLRLRNDLYCVGWGIKLYSLATSCHIL